MNILRKHIFALLGGFLIILLLTSHYTYTYHNGLTLNSYRQGPLPSQPFPLKIWQSWKDDSEPERAVGLPRLWRIINPGWSYTRITDATNDAYIRSTFSHISDVFTKLDDPIMKADYLRYLILLREGGVWADIDVSPRRPISEWIPERYRGSVSLVIGIENDHHKKPIWPGSPYSVQLCQYTMLAKPGHPAMQALVEQVTESLENLIESKEPGATFTFEDVMSTTGPFIFTKVIMDYFTEVTGVLHNGNELDRLQEPMMIGDVLVLPKVSFGWLAHENTHEEGNPKILVQHLFMGSWRGSHPG